MMHDNDNARLAIQKVMGTISRMDQSYNLNVWHGQQQAIEDDLTTTLGFANLSSLALQLLDADKTVVFEYKVQFDGPTRQWSVGEGQGGLELPVFDRRKISGHRLLINRKGSDEAYRHLLKLSWNTAEELRRRTADVLASNHTARITGGRLDGSFDVPADARHLLKIIRAGTRGYAFACDQELGGQSVYLHPDYAPAGFAFREGDMVSAIVVQTERGLQGRNIQPA